MREHPDDPIVHMFLNGFYMLVDKREDRARLEVEGVYDTKFKDILKDHPDQRARYSPLYLNLYLNNTPREFFTAVDLAVYDHILFGRSYMERIIREEKTSDGVIFAAANAYTQALKKLDKVINSPDRNLDRLSTILLYVFAGLLDEGYKAYPDLRSNPVLDRALM